MLRTFTGKMDLDTHPFRMNPNNYIDALNITRNSQGQSSDGPASSLIGNKQVSYVFQPSTLPPVCIGAREDKIRNTVFYAIWHDQGYHSILLYQRNTNTIVKVLESKTDSNGIDILNFQLLYKVTFDFIYRQLDGDILLFNDNYNLPGQINVNDFLNHIYVPVTDDLIRLAKRPPLDEVVPIYITDSLNLVNNLKKKLFQFAISWGYTTNEISTISPISKVVLPIGASGIDNESDPSKNNVLQLNVPAGPADYKYIRIYARQNINNAWGNWFIVDTLNKDDYNISSGGNYIYNFLNDRDYITADQAYMALLWDWSADKCSSLCVVNGDTVLQAGNQTGYEIMVRANVNVQISSSLIDSSGNVPPHNPSLTLLKIGINDDGQPFMSFRVGGDVGGGSDYKIKFTWAVFNGADINIDVEYIANDTDSDLEVSNGLAAAITTQIASAPFTVSVLNGNTIIIQDEQHLPNAEFPSTPTYSATPAVIQSGANAVWKWGRKYRLGLVYVDKYGKSGGVVSFVSTENDATDFSVTTPDFDFNTTTGNPKIPIISASISHYPPAWAVAYYWVRAYQDYQFLEYITCDFQQDSNYIYFCIENLNVFKTNNSGFVPSYTFKAGDRLRVMSQVQAGVDPGISYIIPSPVRDYEVLGTLQKNIGTSTVAGLYVKVKRPSTAPNYASKMMIEIYTPPQQSTSLDTQVFYSFGESYPIYMLDGVGFHTGQNQNQTYTQPATFIFPDGDVYFKYRDFYVANLSTGEMDLTNIYSRAVMDSNYSDYWNSSVNSNGAPWVIDNSLVRTISDNQIRFSLSYQANTDINEINRFYPINYIEVINSYGPIQKIFPWNNGLICVQRHKMGNIPVLQQILYNQDGSSNVSLSAKLLNRIQYDIGEYGCGDVPESIAVTTRAVYGWDNIRGICWRRAQNGLEAISIVHNINSFAVAEATLRGFDYKIYGVFDSYTNKYISSFEAVPNTSGDEHAGNISDAKTLIWTESSASETEGFECFASFLPEMMVSLNNLLITFVNGQLFTHDNILYNTFYGSTYPSSITGVFNDAPTIKKTFTNITLVSGEPWEAQSITTNIKSSYSVISTFIREDEFQEQEGEYHANIPNDTLPPNNRTNGRPIKGNYAIIKLRKISAATFVFINAVIVDAKESVKNAK
jgi:hypothetical protein